MYRCAHENRNSARLITFRPNATSGPRTPINQMSNIKRLLAAALLCTVATPAVSFQTILQDSVTSTFTVTQGAKNQVLTFGIHPSATHGIDTFLGEAELPPRPPTGTFDVRFVDPSGRTGLGLGSRTDYVPSADTSMVPVEHKIQVQRETSNDITISWSLPDTVSGYLRDLFGGAIVDVLMTGSGSTVITNVNLNDFLVLYDPTELPVELAELSAVQDGSDIVLRWTTLSELQNLGFAVLEVSDVGMSNRDVIPLGFVAGAGTTTELHRYAFRVRAPLPGIRRFRLKQVDASGRATYSEMVEIRLESPTFGLSAVYPNPVSGDVIRAHMYGDATNQTELCVVDVLGRTTRCRQIHHTGGTTPVAVALDGVAPGLYFLQATTEAGRVVRSAFMSR